MRVVDRLDHRREETVGEHHLLEQPERQQREAEEDLVGVRPARLLELRDELGRAHDRPRHEVREEGHEQGVIEEAARRRRPPQIDVERVGQGREGVEADPDRKDDVPAGRMIDDAE